MRQAIELARLGRHTAHPNPAVGAVVVNGGQVVGRGYHRGPGSPHAEAVALAEAGPAAKGSDLYVTLEPCSHFGRTPPCTDAILAAGVRRVFVGVLDPDKRVSGNGLELLRRKGVEVEIGIAADEAVEVDPAYFHHRKTGRPFVRYKVAATLDGFVAAGDKTSRWITSEEARKEAHRYRALADAVVVGVGTVLADDPVLTCRLDEFGQDQPLRVVFDTKGRLTGKEKIFSSDGGSSIVFTGPKGVEALSAKLARSGTPASFAFSEELGRWDISQIPRIAVVKTPLRGESVEVEAALQFLGSLDVVEVLLEGGPTLAGTFASESFIDEMVLYVGAKLLGGGGVPILVGRAAQSLKDAEKWRILDVSSVGSDAKLVARPIPR